MELFRNKTLTKYHTLKALLSSLLAKQTANVPTKGLSNKILSILATQEARKVRDQGQKIIICLEPTALSFA